MSVTTQSGTVNQRLVTWHSSIPENSNWNYGQKNIFTLNRADVGANSTVVESEFKYDVVSSSAGAVDFPNLFYHASKVELIFNKDRKNSMCYENGAIKCKMLDRITCMDSEWLEKHWECIHMGTVTGLRNADGTLVHPSIGAGATQNYVIPVWLFTDALNYLSSNAFDTIELEVTLKPSTATAVCNPDAEFANMQYTNTKLESLVRSSSTYNPPSSATIPYDIYRTYTYPDSQTNLSTPSTEFNIPVHQAFEDVNKIERVAVSTSDPAGDADAYNKCDSSWLNEVCWKTNTNQCLEPGINEFDKFGIYKQYQKYVQNVCGSLPPVAPSGTWEVADSLSGSTYLGQVDYNKVESGDRYKTNQIMQAPMPNQFVSGKSNSNYLNICVESDAGGAPAVDLEVTAVSKGVLTTTATSTATSEVI